MPRIEIYRIALPAALAALVCGLYLPFLGNPLVFDDRGFLSGTAFSYYATHPFGLGLRVPAYFSLAVTQVIWGSIEAHRAVSLMLHLCGVLVFYTLLNRLAVLAGAAGVQDLARMGHVRWCAFVSAAVFAVHPVAVYGAGYLIQRSIVLATLFSMLSLLLFVRGLASGRTTHAIYAAFMYSVAVLCKEHAVLLPLVVLPAVWLHGAFDRRSLRNTALYLVLCIPAAVFVILLAKGLIGSSYEPDFERVAAQFEDETSRLLLDYPWRLSAVTQAGLFFKYLGLWLVPDTQAMSVDLRVDFIAGWSAGWIALKVVAFVAVAVAGVVMLRGGYAIGLAGFGLLYAWLLFLVELTTVRYQEPFVLYRSYLWAPGFLMLLYAVLLQLPRRATVTAGVALIALLASLAYERLETFASPVRLWQDAVQKLPQGAVPWGSRTLYNLGREYLYSGQPDKAIAIAGKCAALYPRTFQCQLARGAIYMQLERHAEALAALRLALALQPESGIAYHHLGVTLENMGDVTAARRHYEQSLALGFKGAVHRLSRLDASEQGLLPPRRNDASVR